MLLPPASHPRALDKARLSIQAGWTRGRNRSRSDFLPRTVLIIY
jgi:hypothetical protein